VIKGVVKAGSGNANLELVADGQVTGSHSGRVVNLLEDDRLAGAIEAPPASYASLESPASGVGEAAWVGFLQPLEKGFGLQSRFRLQTSAKGSTRVR